MNAYLTTHMQAPSLSLSHVTTYIQKENKKETKKRKKNDDDDVDDDEKREEEEEEEEAERGEGNTSANKSKSTRRGKKPARGGSVAGAASTGSRDIHEAPLSSLKATDFATQAAAAACPESRRSKLNKCSACGNSFRAVVVCAVTSPGVGQLKIGRFPTEGEAHAAVNAFVVKHNMNVPYKWINSNGREVWKPAHPLWPENQCV